MLKIFLKTLCLIGKDKKSENKLGSGDSQEAGSKATHTEAKNVRRVALDWGRGGSLLRLGPPGPHLPFTTFFALKTQLSLVLVNLVKNFYFLHDCYI